MLEPVRGIVDGYDVFCHACGLVERFENLRLAPHILLPRLAAKGWRVFEGRHWCSGCTSPELLATPSQLAELFNLEWAA